MSTTAQPAVTASTVTAAPQPPSGPRRGGRRGGAGGGRGGKASYTGSTAVANAAAAQPDDTEEVRKLRARYADKLSMLRELFPDWTDEDLLFALQEAGGEVELTVGRISEGHAEQFSSVKSKKQGKKEAGSTTTPNTFQGTTAPSSALAGHANASRGGRGGNAAVRGGRGGATRGARGGGRGGMRGGASGRGGLTDGGAKTGHTQTISTGAPTWADTVAATSSKANGTTGGEWGDDVEGLDLKADSGASGAPSALTDSTAANVSKGTAAAGVAPIEKDATTSSEEPGIVASTLAKILPSKLVPKGSKMSWAQIARPAEPAKAPIQEAKAVEKVDPAKAAIIDSGSLANEEATPLADVETNSKEVFVPSGIAAGGMAEHGVNDSRDHGSSTLPPGLDNISTIEESKTINSNAKPAIGRSAQSQRAIQRAKQQEAVVMANNNAAYDNLGVRFGTLNFLGGEDNDAQTDEKAIVPNSVNYSDQQEQYTAQALASAAVPTHAQQQTQTVPTHQDAYAQATSSPYSSKLESAQQQGQQGGITQHQQAHQIAVAQAQQAHQQLQNQSNNAGQITTTQQSDPQTISQQQYQQGVASAALPSTGAGYGIGINGQTAAQQQQSLSSQYSDYYASLDAQRLSSFYGNYDQQSTAARIGNDDRSGTTTQAGVAQQSITSNDQQQQHHLSSGQAAPSSQQQQQQQHFPNAMPYYYPHYYLPNQFQHYGQPGAGYGQYALYGQQLPQQQQQQQQQHPSKPSTPASLQSPYAAQNGPSDTSGAAGYGNVASSGHYGQSPAVSSALGAYNDGYNRGGNDYSKLYGNTASPANIPAAVPGQHHQQQQHQSNNNVGIPGLSGFLGQGTTPSNAPSGATQMKNGPSNNSMDAYRQYDNGKMNTGAPSQQQQQGVSSGAQQQRNLGQQQGGGATTPQQQQAQQQQQYYQQYNAYAAHQQQQQQQPNAPSGNYQNYQYRQYWG